ncbi:50S ribosomal protein L13 [Candidatus Gromoviella agglomerans]|uniref:50S ribosomal protein L13 n=1 Tax=Candidatus Gromoviella agglomerans TaxID=2806609 RepID=UPI001E45DF08|nr:50S ribosomal protein L13 [Candidatus Gromoviella agglomerans]UFX98591.1 50S ribosomal protein L13 [Candidatus Gromoviella agglomerans]
MKVSEVNKKWIHIDATGLILGRLASIIAMRLRGKHIPSFTPHIDSGNNIVVTNVDKVVLTGKKMDDSRFYWHTGFPGGIKSRSPKQILSSNYSDRLLRKAVERMMPKNKLRDRQMANLYLYASDNHPHHGQVPETIDILSMNAKNGRRF